MAVTRRDLRCSSDEVLGVLNDGWLLGLWVVGASRIREVDESWPEPGSTVHHSVGCWPLLLDDTTRVVELTANRLTLHVRAWPVGEGRVDIDLIPIHSGGTRVTIVENATKGPALLIPRPLRNLLLRWRNTESLRRLAYLAERRPLSRQSATPVPADRP